MNYCRSCFVRKASSPNWGRELKGAAAIVEDTEMKRTLNLSCMDRRISGFTYEQFQKLRNTLRQWGKLCRPWLRNSNCPMESSNTGSSSSVKDRWGTDGFWWATRVRYRAVTTVQEGPPGRTPRSALRMTLDSPKRWKPWRGSSSLLGTKAEMACHRISDFSPSLLGKTYLFINNKACIHRIKNF